MLRFPSPSDLSEQIEDAEQTSVQGDPQQQCYHDATTKVDNKNGYAATPSFQKALDITTRLWTS